MHILVLVSSATLVDLHVLVSCGRSLIIPSFYAWVWSHALGLVPSARARANVLGKVPCTKSVPMSQVYPRDQIWYNVPL